MRIEARHPERAAHLRREWWRLNIVGILSVALLTLMLIGVVWWISNPVPFADLQAWQYCEAAYDRAASTRDSTAVDAQRPVLNRQQAATGLTCGALRQRMRTQR